MDPSISQPSDRLRIVRWTLSTAGLFILLLFLTRFDGRELFLNISRLKLGLFLQAVAFTALNILAKAFRWRLMVRQACDVHPSLGHAIQAVLAGVAGATIFPGRAFDLAKPAMLRVSYDVPFSRAIPAVVAERILDFAALAALFIAAAAGMPRLVTILPRSMLIAAGALFLAALFALLFYPTLWLAPVGRLASSRFAMDRFGRFVASIQDALALMQRSAKGWLVALYSVVAISAEIGRAFSVFQAFDVQVSIGAIALTFAASVIIGLLALIPGGVGVTETSQVSLIALFAPHAPSGALNGAVLVDRLLSYYALVIAGALILLVSFRARSLRSLAEALPTGKSTSSFHEVRE